MRGTSPESLHVRLQTARARRRQRWWRGVGVLLILTELGLCGYGLRVSITQLSRWPLEEEVESNYTDSECEAIVALDEGLSARARMLKSRLHCVLLCNAVCHNLSGV